MKTEPMMKAVNDLKGDLNNLINTKCSKHLSIIENDTGIYGAILPECSIKSISGCFNYICSINEFNALVAELSNWQPTLSVSPLADVTYAEYKKDFNMCASGWDTFRVYETSLPDGFHFSGGDGGTYRNIMNINLEPKPEPETVEYDGMVYEIGKYYIFTSDAKNAGVYDKLNSINSLNETYKFKSGSGVNWKVIKEVDQSTVGTITPAPVKLIDGATYMFELDECKRIGIWHEEIASFFDNFSMPMSEICTQSEPTNITRLVPEGANKKA